MEEIKKWLQSFPLWGEAEPAVDAVSPESGSTGLFPQGTELLEHRENVLGESVRRLRQRYLLRRAAVRGMDAAAWLQKLAHWVAEQDRLGLAPALGQRQQVRAEKGRLIRTDTAGTGIYEIQITMEYTEE